MFKLTLLLLPMMTASYGQSNGLQPHFGLGFEIGTWRPTELNADMSLSILKGTAEHPYLGLSVFTSWSSGFSLRPSVGYWRYCLESTPSEASRIQIISLLLDLKYSLLSDVRLSPYVSYGMGLFFGQETQPGIALSRFDKGWEAGAGINVGTGFDIHLTSSIFLAMEFRYHYLKFKQALAVTNNYSGPKISLGVFYLFQ
ncbi:MAG: outer membrane beta-barrel protein [candidate division KSB1 bacterium]|nr:outer membrane beta-barrel protein [candidate division KSB1 bacterium]MDZ7318617.1 outer membrane beta-barrel protein [candidate division KSB1 bacterium]MDZ7340892.1 outer membrane beta-barrel protein [candidate division KSB1 bacterium]